MRGLYKPAQKGFTLIELIIVMVVVAVGVALAIPSWDSVLQKRQTSRQAEQLAAFLSFAQSEAIKRNDEVSVELVHTSGTNWCVGAAEGNSGCDCTETVTTESDFCDIDGIPFVLSSGEFGKASMSSHSTDVVFVFDPIRGIMADGDLGNAHQFQFQSYNARYALVVNVAATGRVRVCNPDNSKKVPGYENCAGAVVLPPPPP